MISGEIIVIAILCILLLSTFLFKWLNWRRRKNHPAHLWQIGDDLLVYDTDDSFCSPHFVVFKGIYKNKLIILDHDNLYKLIPKTEIDKNISLEKRKIQESSNALRNAAQQYEEFKKELAGITNDNI